MKLKTSVLFASILPIAISSAFAGEATSAKNAPVIVEAPSSIFSSSVTVDYSSVYEFRGVDLGDHLVDADVSTKIDLGNDLALNVGAWYASLVQEDYTELNLYTSLEKTFGDLTLGLGYTWYYFGSDGSDANEVGVTASYALCELVSLDSGAFYDFDTEGYYFLTAASYSTKICDKLSFKATVGISYNLDYYVDDSGFNNTFLQLAFPIALTETATFTPYVRGSYSMSVLDDFQDDIILGGASLNITF